MNGIVSHLSAVCRWLVFALVTGVGVLLLGAPPTLADTTTWTTNQAAVWGEEAIVADTSGNIYVYDTASNMVKKYTGTGAFLGTVGSREITLAGLAASSDGGVYFGYRDYDAFGAPSDYRIVKYDSAGNAVRTVIVPLGSGTGQAGYISAIGTDGADNLYIFDSVDSRVEKFSPLGYYVTQWGSVGNGDGQFGHGLGGLAVTKDGTVYVYDSSNRIQKFTQTGGFLGAWSALFGPLGSIAVDSAGHVYTCAGAAGVQEFDQSGRLLASLSALCIGAVTTYGDSLVYTYAYSVVHRLELTIPDVSLSLSAVTVFTGQQLTATVTASVPFGSITNYAFDFGTGAPAVSGASSVATHTYTAPGSFQVRARVTSARGGSAIVSKAITVLSLSPRPPAVLAPPEASAPGRIGTVGAVMRFTFSCRGAAGQKCQGQATATAIEKLSANGKTITGLLSSKPRTGRYRLIVVARGNVSAAAGASSDVSLRLNSTGELLRRKFKNVPADVKVTVTAAAKVTTIKTAKVTFGADPPKVRILGAPATKRAKVTANLRCQGLAIQVCRGRAQITTFEKLAAGAKSITGLASSPSGNGKLVTLTDVGYIVKVGSKLRMSIQINHAGKALLNRFSRVPATLKLTPTYSGYTLTPLAKEITFKR